MRQPRHRSPNGGQSAVEYALALALVAVVVIGIVTQLGLRTAGAVCQASGGLSSTPTVECPFAGAGPIYALNETTGAVANDSSLRHLQGTYLGTTPGTSYLLDQAGPGRARGVTLDGVSGAVSSPYVQTALTAYSAAIWFRTSRTTAANGVGDALISDRGFLGQGKTGLTLGIRSPTSLKIGAVFFALDSDGVFVGRETTALYNDGAWHYAVGTWAAAAGTQVIPAQFQVYIDGLPVTTSDQDNAAVRYSPLTGSGPIRLGSELAWADNHFDGSVALAAIYDQVVVPQAVALAQWKATAN